MRLDRFQRNEIIEAIRDFGFDPNAFDIAFGEDEARISPRGFESYFIIEKHSGGRHYGSNRVADSEVTSYSGFEWSNVKERFREWLADVPRDLETPDLWAELQGEAELLAAPDQASENTQFTPDEQEQIAAALREFKEEATTTYSLTREQVQAFEAKLDYLIDASRRVGRIDWRNIFIGVAVSSVREAILPREAILHIFGMLGPLIARLLGLDALPPGPHG